MADDTAYVAAQCEFVPRTPPTSVSAAATRGTSSTMLARTTSASQQGFVPLPSPPPPSAAGVAVSRQIPLAIRVRKARVLGVAVALVVLLLVLIAALQRGVVVSRADAARFRSAPRARRQREDDLNFYVGTALALVAAALEVATLFMLPVVVLVLLTEHAMLNDTASWRLGVLLLMAGFVALLTNALSTTYVTAGDPTVIRRIMTARDLAVQGLRDDDEIPRRGVAETMVRSALLPADARAPLGRQSAKCTFGPRAPGVGRSVAARFGFYAGDALRGIAAKGVALDASLNMTVADWLEDRNSTETVMALPHNITIAANLAIHAVQFLADRLRMPLRSGGAVGMLQVYARGATRANDNNSTAALLRATAAMLNASLAPQRAFGFFFELGGAAVQFSRHARGAVRLDAVTLTLPFRRGALRRTLEPTQFDTLRDDSAIIKDGDGDGDGSEVNVFQVFPQNECGTRGCWLRKPAGSREADAVWDVQPEITAFARCRATFDAVGAGAPFTTCAREQVASHSIVVAALGATLRADRLVEYESEGFARDTARIRRANVTGLWRELSVTVAFAAWRVEDLSPRYSDVECAAGTPADCRGLWYPASPESHLLVGARHVAAAVTTDQLAPLTSDARAGEPLVALVSDLPGNASFLAFSDLEQGVYQVTREGSEARIDPTASDTVWPCARDLERAADSVVLQRWSIAQSLQEAYTAALFVVFQFGVAHAVADTPLEGKYIDLFGNVAEYAFTAGIPFKSALVSQLSGVLLLVSVGVAACAGRRRECAIRELADVHRVARVLLVEQFFPKVFLRCTVLTTTPGGQPLAPFRIVAMRLRHATPDGDVFLTLPAAPASPASASSSGWGSDESLPFPSEPTTERSRV